MFQQTQVKPLSERVKVIGDIIYIKNDIGRKIGKIDFNSKIIKGRAFIGFNRLRVLTKCRTVKERRK